MLGGNNTYTGMTAVTAGTLLINGNQSAANGAVTVAAGASLGGAGTIGGSTTIANTATLFSGSALGSTKGLPDLLRQSHTWVAWIREPFWISSRNARDKLRHAVEVGGLLTYNGDLTLIIGGVIADGTYDLFGFGSQTGSGSKRSSLRGQAPIPCSLYEQWAPVSRTATSGGANLHLHTVDWRLED